MDIRRFAIPLATSLVVGGVVYGLSLAGQQSLRSELEQLNTLRSDIDKRFAAVEDLASRLESLDHRVVAVEKTLPAAPVVEAAPPPAVAEPTPAAPAQP
ncbi:exported hypothetical protein [Magnetospirillum molischianum DSM 120]|uniref:Uncharacterized protein n=2 Tax=Magnetospirillum molischianum TaxID=1083 RepID=H8FRH9_MAGML|nr:exported hypothetical protein [Magnetospirillum molischianum DSM 120]